MKIASIIALYFKKLGVEFLKRAQLNLKDSKYLWPSVWVGLLVMLSLIFVRFDNPLPIQVHQPSAKIQFLSTDSGIYAQDRFQSLELFDTAPLFIPTQWNYASSIFPDKRVSSLAEFSEFKPSMNLVENLELPRLKERGENSKTLLGEIYYEPRILNLSKSSASSSSDQWDSQSTLKLKVETLRGLGEQAVGIDFFEYQLEYSALVNLEQPVIVLLRNQDALAPRPILFQSSSVNDFDTAILGWLDEKSHLALLPKGLLRLTFYP